MCERIDIWLNNNDKQPDASLRIRPSHWPNFPNPNPFQINIADGTIAPGFVLEIAMENEPATSFLTRACDFRWVIKSGSIANGNWRWWVGSSSRDFVGGIWQNTHTIHIHPLFPVVHWHNRLTSLAVPGQVTTVPVTSLIDPLPIPAGCPAVFTIDLE
jgi:hypothetical protein